MICSHFFYWNIWLSIYLSLACFWKIYRFFKYCNFILTSLYENQQPILIMSANWPLTSQRNYSGWGGRTLTITLEMGWENLYWAPVSWSCMDINRVTNTKSLHFSRKGRKLDLCFSIKDKFKTFLSNLKKHTRHIWWSDLACVALCSPPLNIHLNNFERV